MKEETIKKISSLIAEYYNESVTPRWWKSVLDILVMGGLFVGMFFTMWLLSLFTKLPIYFVPLMIFWIGLFIYMMIVGMTDLEMKVYFWLEEKNPKVKSR